MESKQGEYLNEIKPINIDNRWCVHSYYTLCPYAPDNSGRLLLAGADVEKGVGEILIVSDNGQVLERFGQNALHSGFYHTGFWQTWSPDARFIYYQSGSLQNPKIVRRELSSGKEITINGDMEGAPPTGEPIISGLMGMLYAAGYGDGSMHPEMAPVPYQHRNDHGLFEFSFEPKESRLVMSVSEMLEKHPHRDKLIATDKEIRQSLGAHEGSTLMCYCVRWNPKGDRLLFYFGNHCVDTSRGEPKLAYIMTSDRSFKEIHMAVDLSYGRRGVHWSWHPDGEHLIGYGPDPENENRMCLAQVKFDGSDYKKISKHASGGHPSISPVNYDLLVTDTGGQPGEVLFIDVKTDRVIKNYYLPRVYGDMEPKGRNQFRVCHHPVFSRDGSKVLINTLPGRFSTVCEILV